MPGFDTDNLVYNRFDLIYGGNVERYTYECGSVVYSIDAHYENGVAVMNAWGKKFPQRVFESAVDDILAGHPEIRYIDVKKSGNDYRNMLDRGNDIRVPIPGTPEELIRRLSSKHQYTLRRLKRLIEAQYGPLKALVYDSDIPDEVVGLYFKWKMTTHGTDYRMPPGTYLKKYHVTHAVMLKAGNKDIGIIFLCVVDDIAYLENMSYDTELGRFSVGYLTYESALEQLVKMRCSYLYLGGGDYHYKKRFGAEENEVYSGTIYNRQVFDGFNAYIEKHGIRKAAIYGMGAGGREFLKLAHRLNMDIAYCIDKEKKDTGKLRLYTLEDKLPDADAAIITLKNHDKEAEKFLLPRFRTFFYWEDFAKRNYIGGMEKWIDNWMYR